MIDRLRRKFILVSTVSVFSVILIVFLAMLAFDVSSMNRAMDELTNAVSDGDGRFPESFGENVKPEHNNKPIEEKRFDFITPETKFSTRYFTVWYDGNGEVEKTNTSAIYSIDEENAIRYAEKAMNGSSARGWVSGYRYKIFDAQNGKAVVFVDGSIHRASLLQSLTVAAAVLLGCAVLVLALIILLSGRVVKPMAESYEKQKQFVTDANHELKTPLTLILANLDIAEAELGKNEWLEDIRTEGNRMAELINQLVALSRMDEESQNATFSQVSLGDMLSEATSEFAVLAESRGKRLTADIEAGVTVNGDELLLRRLVSILLDNAVKYCDAGGDIYVSLVKKRRTVLTVENSYADVENTELDRLTDRFYRADSARTYAGGYGIGLSIAKAIVEKHHGELIAYKKDQRHIGFKTVL